MKSLDDLVPHYLDVVSNEVVAAIWCNDGAKNVRDEAKMCGDLVPNSLAEARNEVIPAANPAQAVPDRQGLRAGDAPQGLSSPRMPACGKVAVGIEAGEMRSLERRAGEGASLAIQRLNRRIGGPMGFVDTGLHVAMETGVRPVGGVADMTGGERVVMDRGFNKFQQCTAVYVYELLCRLELLWFRNITARIFVKPIPKNP